MTTDSQNRKILAYLKAGKKITPLKALQLFGSFRLGARIYDLRKLGHEIESRIVQGANGKRFAEYWMEVEK
jgi:hypothetical protein